MKSLLALLLLCTPCAAGELDYLRLRLRFLEIQKTPVVAPKPTVVDTKICTECDGVGCSKCDGGRVTFLTPQEATATGKPWALLVTDSKGCEWCDRLEADLGDPELVAASQNFALVKVDRETTDPEAYKLFADTYNVTTVPVWLYFGPGNKSLGRTTGYYPNMHRAFDKIIQRAAVRSRPVMVEAYEMPMLQRSMSVCGPNGCN
jgi:hypothetical protein